MSEVWVLDEKRKKQYGYNRWTTRIGAWPIEIIESQHPPSFGISWFGSYDEWEDSIGEAPTLHGAKKKAIEWVLEQIRVASAEVAEAALEWQAEEERGER